MHLAEIKLQLSDKSNLTKFMEEWWKQTDFNPFNERERIADGKIGIECYPFYGNIHLSAIRSLEPNQGAASIALDKFLKLADSFSVSVECDPKPFGNKGLNKASLTAWYKRHGFAPKKGYHGTLIHPPSA